MKIALLSDSHNNWDSLRSAVNSQAAHDCEVAFFAGDLCRPKGVGILAKFPGPVHQIVGNMDQNIDSIWAHAEKTDNVIFHGEVCDIKRSGLRIYMNHHPEPTEQKAQSDLYDICIHGHLHEFSYNSYGDTKIINPGAITQRSRPPEWAVFDTQQGAMDRLQV